MEYKRFIVEEWPPVLNWRSRVDMPRGTTTTSVFIAALCVAASAFLILAIPIPWSVLATAGVAVVAAFMIIGVRGGGM